MAILMVTIAIVAITKIPMARKMICLVLFIFLLEKLTEGIRTPAFDSTAKIAGAFPPP